MPEPAAPEEDGETADEAELLRRDEIRRGKAVVNPDDMIDIKVKLSDRDNRPVVVTINKQDTVRIVTKKIYEESGVCITNLSPSTFCLSLS